MRDEVETRVLEVVADVLDVPPAELAPDTELEAHGWDSRALLETFAQLESELSVRLDFRHAQAARSAADLIALVRQGLPAPLDVHSTDDEPADASSARVRWRQLTRQQRQGTLRVALLAGFTVDPLVPHLGVALSDRGLDAEVWAGPYGQIERQCLDDASQTARFAPDVLIVSARLEELWANLPLPPGRRPDDYWSDLRYVADACLDAARRWQCRLVFVLPAVPPQRPVGDHGDTAGVGATAAHVREALRHRLAGHDRVLVLDADVLVRTLGERHTYRPELQAATRIPFTEEYFELWGQAAAEVLASAGDAPQQAGASALTLDDFLSNLRLDVRISPLTDGAAADAADLTRRVAEFHLNGAVWPEDRFAGRGADDPRTRWAITVSDRFGDHGFCGVVVTHTEQRAMVVDLWVLTCPVLGKGVEEQVLRRLEEHARGRGCDTLRFDYRPTERNDALREFLGGLVPALPHDGAAPVEVPVTGQDATPRQDPATATPQPAKPATPQPAKTVTSQPVGTEAPQPAKAAAAAPVKAPAVAGRRRVKPAAAATQIVSASQILEAVHEHSRGRDQPVVAGANLDEGPPPRTEAESALAEVFAGVLRRPVLGVDCNFFTTGDSMLAVQLIAKANQAGYRLTLRQVFQHQTLAALASVAEPARRKQAPEQAPEPARDADVMTAPLLPLQAWFFRLGLPRPNHFNQSQRYELPADLDVAALRRAITALIEHHQALRMRFVQTAHGLRQLDPGPPAEPPLEVHDLSGVAPDARQATMDAEELRLQIRMSPGEGRLIQFAVFTFGDDAPPRLLLIMHHLAIDGISWRILLEDFQQAYHQAVRGAVRLAPVGIPVLAWARRLHEHAQSAAVRAELPVWLSESRRRVQPIPLDLPEGDGSGVFTDFEEAVFTAEETRALQERAVSVDRVSLDVLLLAGANRALAAWTGRREFLFDVVNHGREPFADGVDLSRTIAWLVMNVPVLFEIDADLLDVERPVEALVGPVDRQLRTWSGTHGAGDNLLRHLSEDETIRRQLAELPAADVLFSYAGHVDPHATEFPLLGRQIDGTVPDMDRDAGTPYALQFDAMIVGDRMRLEVCYRQSQHHTATAQALLKSWTSSLRGLLGETAAPLPRPAASLDRWR